MLLIDSKGRYLWVPEKDCTVLVKLRAGPSEVVKFHLNQGGDPYFEPVTGACYDISLIAKWMEINDVWESLDTFK